MKRQWGIGVGAASILIIFVLLCLTVFATLSLVSAQADLRLAERAAQTVTAYYDADARACALLSSLADEATRCENDLTALQKASVSVLGEAMVSNQQSGGALLLLYRVEIDQNRSLEASVSFRTATAGELTYTIEGWQTVQTGGWAEEQPLALWPGGLAGLPNLEGLS